MSSYVYRLAYRLADGSLRTAQGSPRPRMYESLGSAKNARSLIWGGSSELVIQRIPADDWETVDDPQA